MIMMDMKIKLYFLAEIGALYPGSSLTDSLTHSLTGAILGQSAITQ